MTYGGNESRLGTGSPEKSVTNRRKAIVWILVALGFLIVGLIGGTVAFAWKREWAWVLPAATFAAYLLAFRRGMLLWNPAIDRTWRRYLWLDHEVIAEDEVISQVADENPAKTLRIRRPEAPRESRRVLRVL